MLQKFMITESRKSLDLIYNLETQKIPKNNFKSFKLNIKKPKIIKYICGLKIFFKNPVKFFLKNLRRSYTNRSRNLVHKFAIIKVRKRLKICYQVFVSKKDPDKIKMRRQLESSLKCFKNGTHVLAIICANGAQKSIVGYLSRYQL